MIPTAGEFEAVLRRHVLDVWFPRSLDFDCGGFLCDFDRAWKPNGPHEKLLEFQARHTLLAAEASLLYSHDAVLRQAALHGYRYLRDTMWDKDLGGWYHRLDRAGRPLEGHTKHVHGITYAIQACVAVHAATGEPGALDLARTGFEWQERHAHDSEHGGYFGFLKRDGIVIRTPSDCPWPATDDTISTPIGFKDANVQSDHLETLTYLHRAWPDAKVMERLTELIGIVATKIISRESVYYFLQPDWTPVPGPLRFGYLFQHAHRLLAASRLTGNQDEINSAVRTAVDLALRFGWDTGAGGFFLAGPGPGTNAANREKHWWVQTEALKALLALGPTTPANSTYHESFARHWSYLRRHFFDTRFGGTYALGMDCVAGWRRRFGAHFAPPHFTRKGDVWKDASHDGRAFLFCLAALRDR